MKPTAKHTLLVVDDEPHVADSIRDLLRRDFRTFPTANLLPEALPIAFSYGQAVYDCLYVALAVQSESQVITADERLANALAAHLPVKWLGGL